MKFCSCVCLLFWVNFCFLCVVWCGWMAGCCCCVLVVEEGFGTELQDGLDIVLSKLVATKFWSNLGLSWRRLWLKKCLEQILVSVEGCDKFWCQLKIVTIFWSKFWSQSKIGDKFFGAILCQLKTVIKKFRANLWYLDEKIVINFGANICSQLKKIVIKNLEQLWVSIGLDEELKVRSLEPIILFCRQKKIAAFVVAVFVVYVRRRQEFAKLVVTVFCVCICRQEFFFFFF